MKPDTSRQIYEPINEAAVEGKPMTDSDWRQVILNVSHELHLHQEECARLQRDNKLLPELCRYRMKIYRAFVLAAVLSLSLPLQGQLTMGLSVSSSATSSVAFPSEVDLQLAREYMRQRYCRSSLTCSISFGH